MNTRRYPRTMQEAFGPYTSREIYEPQRPLTLAQILYIPAAVAGIGWILLMVFA